MSRFGAMYFGYSEYCTESANEVSWSGHVLSYHKFKKLHSISLCVRKVTFVLWLLLQLIQAPLNFLSLNRPAGRGSSLLATNRFYMHRLTVHFKCPIEFEICPLALMLLRITAIKTSLVAAMRVCS